jgi:hypothetical protein
MTKTEVRLSIYKVGQSVLAKFYGRWTWGTDRFANISALTMGINIGMKIIATG